MFAEGRGQALRSQPTLHPGTDGALWSSQAGGLDRLINAFISPPTACRHFLNRSVNHSRNRALRLEKEIAYASGRTNHRSRTQPADRRAAAVREAGAIPAIGRWPGNSAVYGALRDPGSQGQATRPRLAPGRARQRHVAAGSGGADRRGQRHPTTSRRGGTLQMPFPKVSMSVAFWPSASGCR